MSDLDKMIARLADEAAIRDVIARFADTAIRADFEGFRKLWTGDAEVARRVAFAATPKPCLLIWLKTM